jgi:IS30 family transposase
VSIHERPDAINQRSEFGHWEGDTVLGAKTDHDGIHTEVERTSKYLMAYKIPDLSATTTAITQLAMFTKLPAHALRSTTLDNGAENHRHYLLNLLAVQVFFADPYSAWQRGTNEHFNGVLRRYLPKGTSLTTLTDQELADIVEEINNRPLKCLNWNTPTETFQQQLHSNQHTNVALLN